VVDVFSRRVVGQRLSTSLRTDLTSDAPETAVAEYIDWFNHRQQPTSVRSPRCQSWVK
jgi:hypothetical protein